MEHTTNPLDEQEIFCVKERIPEIDISECFGTFSKVHQFNGVALEASSDFFIGDKIVATNVLMKPNCMSAISQSNKRYLESFNMYTDYIEPNPLLFKALGFSEDESKIMVYVKFMHDLPVDAVVTAYDLDGDNKALAEPSVSFSFKNGAVILYDEAVKLLTEWLDDNDYESNHYEDIDEMEDISDAWSKINVSHKAKTYAAVMEEDLRKQLKLACLYEAATTLLDDMALASTAAYTLLQKKYTEAGLIIAKIQFTWGLDKECDLVLCNEVGTNDNTVIASRELYDKNGTLENIIEMPIYKFFESINYDVDCDETIPEIPGEVLDELSDTYVYLAETLCDDLALEIHL